jgi:competence protein ComEC
MRLARRPRIAVIGACAALAAIGGAQVLSGAPAPPRAFTVTFLAVGQGDATLAQAPGGYTALVDGGPPEADVAAMLRARGVTRLDVIVLTHAQADHEGGLETVLGEFPVDVMLDGGNLSDGARHRRILALARARGVRVVPAAAGERLRLGRFLRLDVLSPHSALDPARGRDPNTRAAVLQLSYRGLDVLLPADAESDVTAPLALRRVEVLKVAHHGSADEGLGALIERLRPVAAVIPVGAANRYGHPHPATLAALRAAVPRVYRTDRDGAVTLTLGPDGPAIRSER